MCFLQHTNEVTDTYVTTGARLNIYSYLDVLKREPSTAIGIP
jgi:hypothetical protein